MKRTAVVVDLDSTLIDMETIDELAKLCGKYKDCSAITRQAMNGEIDFTTSLCMRVELLAGLNADYAWNALFANLRFCSGAQELLTYLLFHCKYHVVIASGGFLRLTSHVAGILGVHEYHANNLQVSNGAFTGQLCAADKLVDAEYKREIVKREQHEKGAFVIAIGDGANDVPMLQAADLAIAAPLAKPSVIQHAHHHISNLLEIIPILESKSHGC